MRLLIGGSPCTYWSIAQTKNRETEASGLGWELFQNYVLARDRFQPDFFLYENNKSMSSKIREQITAMLGMEPVLINSALVSAQNRQRLYWVGKRNPDGTYSKIDVAQPENLGIMLRDVLETGVCWNEKAHTLDASYYKGGNLSGFHRQSGKRLMVAEPVDIEASAMRQVGRRINAEGHRDDYNMDLPCEQRFEVNENPQKTNCLSTVTKDNMVAEPVRIGTIENAAQNQSYDSQQYRVYSPDGKGVTICGNGGGLGAKTGLYATPVCVAQRGRYTGKNGEVEQHFEVQTSGKTNTLTTVQKDNMVAEPVIDAIPNDAQQELYAISPADGKKYPIYEVRDGQITIKSRRYPIKLADGYYIIRKLTVLECMRLQTVPETYKFPVSEGQAYKMLGNGWTCRIISHIMSHMTGLTDKPLDVLSMYDGMACGHIALDTLGADIKRYIATEIDKYAIKTATHNFPEIEEFGDAFAIRDENSALCKTLQTL